MKKKNEMKESEIQSKIKTTLQNAGWLVVKLIQTNTNGIPDLIALRNSTTVFIEVKRPGQKPTPLQSYRHDQLKKQGFIVITATSTDQINHLCHPSYPQVSNT